MGKIDVETKEYVNRPEVFADLFNYLLYDGKQVIKPEELKELDSTSIFISDDKSDKASSIQKHRDILKNIVIKEDKHLTYALILGIENQTNIHYAMPVRNMEYDAYTYANQVANSSRRNLNSKTKGIDFLSGLKREDKISPVITLVLYFGQKPWNGPMRLHEMLSTNKEEILKYVPDYKINLISPVSMKEEEINKFKSNFWELATFISYGRDKKAMSKLANDDRFRHVDPLVANIANDLTDAKLELNEDEEGKVDMCIALQELSIDWKNEGRLEGKNEGMMEKSIDVAKQMLLKNKLSFEDISDYSGLSLEKVKELAKEVNKKS